MGSWHISRQLIPCRADCKFLIGLRPNSVRRITSAGSGATQRSASWFCIVKSWNVTLRGLNHSSSKVKVDRGENGCDHWCWTCSFTYIFCTDWKCEWIGNKIPSCFVRAGKVHSEVILYRIRRLITCITRAGTSIVRIGCITARIYSNRLTSLSNYRPTAVECYRGRDRYFIVCTTANICVITTSLAPSITTSVGGRYIPVSVINCICTSHRKHLLWWERKDIGSRAFFISKL